MTREEAVEAGKLAEALEELGRLISEVRGSDEDEMALGCSVGLSDAGSTGFGPDVVLPPSMVAAGLDDLRNRIELRLQELGVQP